MAHLSGTRNEFDPKIARGDVYPLVSKKNRSSPSFSPARA